MGDLMVSQPGQVLTADTMEKVLGRGDLKSLTPQQRLEYLGVVCKSLGLNPLTQPLAFQELGGKTVLYARKECTDQLRRLHGVNIQVVSREKVDDLLIVTVRGTTADGRSDESIGAVSIAGLRGEAMANAAMKAETKAKRRVTLSLCGLGVMDESEVDSVQQSEALARPSIGGIVHMEEPVDPSMAKALEAFATIKQTIGPEAYYRILGNEGYEHANEIKRVEDRRRVYGLMQMEAKAHA